jgi:hypothetical protein
MKAADLEEPEPCPKCEVLWRYPRPDDPSTYDATPRPGVKAVRFVALCGFCPYSAVRRAVKTLRRPR